MFFLKILGGGEHICMHFGRQKLAEPTHVHVATLVLQREVFSETKFANAIKVAISLCSH